MTIKYAPVFGDQSLFDTAPDECFCVAKNVYDDSVFYKEIDQCLFWHDGGKWKPLQFMSCTPIAMRRIIKTPTWTWEDKKAGRLPEVGCVVMAIGVNEVARIAAINNDSVCSVCVVFEDGDFITLHFSGIAPIETPEEKAARLKEEWCEAAKNHYFSEEKGLDFFSITYDALLSGELKAPTNE